MFIIFGNWGWWVKLTGFVSNGFGNFSSEKFLLIIHFILLNKNNK